MTHAGAVEWTDVRPGQERKRVELNADEELSLKVKFSGVSQFVELPLASSAALKDVEDPGSHNQGDQTFKRLNQWFSNSISIDSQKRVTLTLRTAL